MLLYVWSWNLHLFWGIHILNLSYVIQGFKSLVLSALICWDMNSPGSAYCFLLLLEFMKSFPLFFLLSSVKQPSQLSL